ncbi:DUF3052 domain-containing protein [Corynebacterium yudongzhengii]|uniref:DUF3052 domain-containing protein n=1 Tax=Corynebacterium yudongzhengii TaxID=2080740 RepID=A0A2U1T7H9_9CORY|nr:DUF3052 domain-containing protein [Corynebacterium yudongzhengii]AWB81496.1 DUF3052 domain-containing protein [Corynebacterium yudongzhengii]PWC01933.1 DUF3052 domain-containing protein [Corynebacterium yudongzhengii]
MVDAPGAVNDNDAAQDFANRLCIEDGMTVQELGWSDDCDPSIPEAVEDRIGEALLDEDTDELCDVILLWWHDDDGDLVDGLVDALRNLDSEGCIWLLTPGAGKEGTVPPGEISESAQLAGLVQTKSDRFGGFQGSCLVARGNKR